MTVRLAGTSFAALLGMELTGQDWIALAPENHRASRLGLFKTITAGAFCVATRRIDTGRIDVSRSEEILLPLAADPANGVYSVLCHVDLKEIHSGDSFLSRAETTGAPDAFELIALPGLVQA